MKKITLSSLLCFSFALAQSQVSDTIVGVGDFMWTAPAWVTQVSVDLWGTGGDGGNVNGGGYGGSGCGGGGYSKKNAVNVVPFVSYLVHIGPAGEVTYFIDSTTVLANNGHSGGSGPVPDPLPGGLGGSTNGAVGDIVMAGGNGGAWSNLYGSGGSGGGSAGSGGNGGDGDTSAAFNVGGAGGAAGIGTPGGAAGANGVGFGNNGINGIQPGGGASGGGNMASIGGTGGSGVVIITYSFSMNTGDNSSNLSNVVVFPNPGNGAFQVLATSEILGVRVLNVIGEVVFTEECASGKTKSLNLAGFEKGIYFVEVNTNGQISTQKIAIQ